MSTRINPAKQPYREYMTYQGYPANAVGATQMTKDVASYCYDTQREKINETYSFMTSPNPSYKWPLIGTFVSAVALMAIRCMK